MRFLCTFLYSKGRDLEGSYSVACLAFMFLHTTHLLADAYIHIAEMVTQIL